MKHYLEEEELNSLKAIVSTLCNGLFAIVEECERERDMYLMLEKLCGQWQCSTSNSRFLIFRENEEFKLMFMKKRGIFRKLEVETFPILTDARWPYFIAVDKLEEPQVLVYMPSQDKIRFSLREEFCRIEPPQIVTETESEIRDSQPGKGESARTEK